jgi:hypothetical protein
MGWIHCMGKMRDKESIQNVGEEICCKTSTGMGIYYDGSW